MTAASFTPQNLTSLGDGVPKESASWMRWLLRMLGSLPKRRLFVRADQSTISCVPSRATFFRKLEVDDGEDGWLPDEQAAVGDLAAPSGPALERVYLHQAADGWVATTRLRGRPQGGLCADAVGCNRSRWLCRLRGRRRLSLRQRELRGRGVWRGCRGGMRMVMTRTVSTEPWTVAGDTWSGRRIRDRGRLRPCTQR